MYIKNLFTICCLIVISNISFAQNEPFQLRQVACDLEQPWEITYGPNNQLWVTESRAYKLLRIDPNSGVQSIVLDATNLKNFPNNQNPWPQGGFTGVALHPDLLNDKPYVYVAYTYQFDGCQPNDQGCFFKTKIERYNYNNGTLSNPQTVLDNIPGSNDHNGGRLLITTTAGIPYLFYTVGDMGAGQFRNAERPNNAQDPNNYEGKILRLNTEPVGGSWIPNTNPFGNAVWTLGHRNPQGLAVGQFGDLYSAEHGPYTDDEVNIINQGNNYGHPLVSGFADGNYNGAAVGTGSLLPIINNEFNNANGITNYENPIASYYAVPNNEVVDWYNYAVAGTEPFPNAWLFRPSIAPSGIGYYGQNTIPNWSNSLLITSLKKATIYRQPLSADGKSIAGAAIPYFEGLGRFRDVAISPDGSKIYVVCDKFGATSGPTQGTSIAPNNPGCILEFEYTPGLTGCQNSYDGFTFIGDYNNAKYFISNKTSNWINGSSLAEFYQGYLASPNDQSENNLIQSYLQSNNEIAFIGVSDLNTEGTLELASGEPTTFNNFTGTNSENNDYAVMNFWDGSWSLNNITTERRYIIEIPCSTTCIDIDGDGVCADQDCNDNNPNLPTNPGTPCDDNDATTENDQINMDGCTCIGTPILASIDLTCQEDITIAIPQSSTTVQVDFDFPTAFTNCPVGSVNITQITGPAPNSFLSIGSYQVIFSANDECGNNVGCGIIITVTNAPVGCNVAYTTNNSAVTVTGLTNSENAKLFDDNINVIWECNPWNGNPCSNTELISGLTSGNYFLSVQSTVCDEWIPITIQGGCVDMDNDGICADQDCDDNNPVLPATPGTSCNDNDGATQNDVILDDGCTCEGTFVSTSLGIDCPDDVIIQIAPGETTVIANWPDAVATTTCPQGLVGPAQQVGGVSSGTEIGPGSYFLTYAAESLCGLNTTCSITATVLADGGNGCNINTAIINGDLSITGLTSGENTKLFDENYAVLFECNPWSNNNCTSSEIVSNLPSGTYFLSVQSGICDEFIPLTINANTCQVTTDVVGNVITINGLPSNASVQLLNDENFPIYECMPNFSNVCDNPEIINGVPDGQFTLVIQSDNCNESIPILIQENVLCELDATVSNVACDGVTLTYDLFVDGTFTDDNMFFLNVQIAQFETTLLELEYGQTHQIIEYIFNSDGKTINPFDKFNDPNCAASIEIACSSNECDIQVEPFNSEAGLGVNIYGLTAAENTKIFDENFNVLWECNPWNNNPCFSVEELNYQFGFSQGETYFLSVQSDNCDEFIPFTIPEGSGDSDGDGIPDNQDCEPNDPDVPASAGTPCNDNNHNTENDVIQSDMCTCAGTPVVGGCNVSYSETDFGEITITGLTSAENTKIFDSSASSSGIVWQCNPWSTDCTNTEVVSGLIPNAQYYLAVQSTDCNEWIPFMVSTVLFNNNHPIANTRIAADLNNFSIINLFPNPVSDEAFVTIDSNFDGDVLIEVYNIIGVLQKQQVANLEEGNNTTTLKLSDLKTGIYHLVIKDKNGQTESTRFVKS